MLKIFLPQHFSDLHIAPLCVCSCGRMCEQNYCEDIGIISFVSFAFNGLVLVFVPHIAVNMVFVGSIHYSVCKKNH